MKYITPEDYLIAEQNGINRATLEARVRYYNWPIEKAIKQPVKKYGDYPEIAERNGIKKSVFYKRVSLGWDEQTAATMPVKKRLFSPTEDYEELVKVLGL
ncbi:hypothetical protein SAMN05216389_1269 [Oceanobacillus limi]|uniref:Uncharacterized protein n=1 Tax=Oceanobacillus limi TaxID=930131 RepID=A0A1I0H1F4_9BACI|nr:hypothetical protein [Oceanobacillus limi]SET76500.1 hypothetical protein SAMN05216389_1269 [Oceanobacillus limi]